MVCPPVREIIHELKLVVYILVQADKPWYNYYLKSFLFQWGGAKVLGKLPVQGRPTKLDYSRARACCACSRCGWRLFGHFFSHLSHRKKQLVKLTYT